jgi:hypothetical protein
MKFIKIGMAAAAGIAAVGMTASMAAASGPIVAVTHSAVHDDTTSVPTGVNSDNGPVWAYDNLSERFTVVPEASPGNWSVTIDVSGSFAGFANPRTAAEMTAAGLTSPAPGAPLTSHGSVKGTIQYDVSSPNAPDKAALPAQEPDHTGLGAALSQLFDGNESVVGGGAYTFSYNLVDGVRYTQTG